MQSKCVQKLKSILEANKNLKALVEKSIAKAKENNSKKWENIMINIFWTWRMRWKNVVINNKMMKENEKIK